MSTLTKRLLAVLLAVVFVVAACSSDGGDDGGDSASTAPTAPTCDQEGTLNVPDDYDTIQAAADAAAPGALVLIAEGTYEEAVNVTCPDITLRGIDRNNVVLEGNFELENGIRILETDGVVVENMTAQNYTGNGFFWTGADGYRGSYLTAIRNGDYGVYAYGSVNGVFEHSYGSGSPDAGIYIGQCGDCNAVVDDFTSEWNGLGYSGTNSTNVTIINSTFRHNRSGIVPNAGSYEGCAPPVRNTIVGNVASDNGNLETSAIAGGRRVPRAGASSSTARTTTSSSATGRTEQPGRRHPRGAHARVGPDRPADRGARRELRRGLGAGVRRRDRRAAEPARCGTRTATR